MVDNYIDKTLEFIANNGYKLKGNQFLKETAIFLTELLDVNYAIIDKYSIEEPVIANIECFYTKKEQKFFPNKSYSLYNTPCENVINKSVCSYPSNTKNLFPKDALLTDLKIESYIGIPLWNSKKEPIGLIAIMDDKPTVDVKSVEKIIQIIAIKIEKVLESIIFNEQIIKKNIDVETSQKNFEELSNLTFEGILIHKEGVAIDVNLSIVKMFGYKKEELIGKNVVELLFDKQFHQKIYNESKKSHAFHYEIEGIRKDKTTFFVEIESKLIQLGDAKKIRVAAIRDISRRRQAEINLNEAQKIANIGTFVLDVATGSWESTPILDEMLGIDTTFIKNVENTALFIHPEDQQTVLIDINDLIEKKIEFYNKEYRIIGIKDKKVRWINTLGKLEFDKKGNPTKLLGTIQDITFSKNRSRELQNVLKKAEEGENRLFEAQKIAGLGCFTFDINLDCWDSSILLNNIFGIDSSYNQNMDGWLQLVHPEDRADLTSYLEKDILINHSFFDKQYRIIRNNDKEIRWVHGYGKLNFDKNNNPIQLVGTIQDISPSIKIQEELQNAKQITEESEGYLKQILQTANEGFWIINEESKTTDVNIKMCSILGYKKEEIIGKSIFEFVDEKNGKTFKKQIKLRKKGLASSYEIELLKKNNSIVICLFNTSPIYDSKNDIKGSFALVTDITTLKVASNKLKLRNEELNNLSLELFDKNKLLVDSRNRFINLFDHSPVSLWEEDFSEVKNFIKNNGVENENLDEYFNNNHNFLLECISKIKILKVNKNTLNLFGAKDIDELDTHLKKSNTELSFQTLKKEIIAVTSEDKTFACETEFNKIDGTLIYAILKSEIDSDGKAIVSVIDITDIKETRNQLNNAKLKAEKSDERYKLAVSATGLGIWDWDVVSDKSYYSKLYKEQLGYKENELENKFSIWKELLHPIDYESTVLKLENYLKNPVGQYISEFRLQHSNGSYIWILSTAESIKNEKGEVIRMFGSHRDITVRKKALLELKKQTAELVKAKEKAEESNNLKTEFLNNMSHEIRTPMNGILGFSQFLSDDNLPSSKRNYFIKIIQNSGNQLLRVIDDILEISQLETKQVKVIEKPVCLNDLLMELFSVFDIKAKENQIPLYIKTELTDEQSTIYTDKSKLNKIVSNLLENSLKYTNKGSINFGYKLINNKIEIFVKDTGIGINLEKQKIIFERFSQENEETSKTLGGLGLGLSIAKENTELLGGEISVNSIKWKGSTFTVSIPYKPVNTSVEIDNDKNNIIEAKPKYTILVAEDEEINYLFIEILLSKIFDQNCYILHAKDGLEAVEICNKRADIDVVLMDINMPKMNGFDATKGIRKTKPKLPIIVQTAYSSAEDKEKAFSAGCNDFISKPINIEELKSILGHHLSMKL